MEINLADLECTRLSDVAFRCVADAPNTPWWFYPVVLACFCMALVILVLVAYMTLSQKSRGDRREVNKYVPNDRRKP